MDDGAAIARGYDAAVVVRFLFFALPVLLALVAGSHFAIAALGWGPPSGLPARTLFSGWLLEATGLTALFLLIQARGLPRFVAGLGAAWTAWIFRGPVLLVTIAGASRVPSATWWRLSLVWFVLYTLCGLALAALADDEPREDPPPPVC
ncbi:MAG: hypothetical protein SF066_00095 [Thermoanaerobaculia bacterium]|nr:hypothetical protein [Thermoanaerobaculia bacterium]